MVKGLIVVRSAACTTRSGRGPSDLLYKGREMVSPSRKRWAGRSTTAPSGPSMSIPGNIFVPKFVTR